jgi:hypothetical protein
MALRWESRAEDFYRLLRMRCPACGSFMNADPSARGVDVQLDQCVNCHQYLVIDLTDPTVNSGKVIVESHAEMADAMTAATALTERQRNASAG